MRAMTMAAVLLLGPALPPAAAEAAEFTDAAGRIVMLPPAIARVMPADRNAEVLVFVLAPNKLAGLERPPGRGALLPRTAHAALLGWRQRSNPASMAETAQRLRPDLIIDAAPVTPGAAVFADQVQQLTGIPYILVDDSFARLPAVLRSIGALLGVGDRADELGLYAEHAIAGLRGRLLIRPAKTRPHVYFALGPDGLVTALPGSPAGEAIDEAGAINVAGALGRGTDVAVTPALLSAWNPDIIIAEDHRAYDRLRRGGRVRGKQVYLEPTSPFGWVEDPSGVNRLIGLYWLSSLFYPDSTQEDLRTTVCDFYDKFYRIKLTNRALEAMLRPAGVPPPEAAHPVGQGEPLVGLGAAPPSTLPSGTPGAVGAQPGTAPAMPDLPPMPGATPSATCTVPTGPVPQPLPGIVGAPGAAPPGNPGGTPPVGTPGVPPPGRRGHGAGLVQPGTAPQARAEPAEAEPSAAAARSADTALATSSRPDSVSALLRSTPPAR